MLFDEAINILKNSENKDENYDEAIKTIIDLNDNWGSVVQMLTIDSKYKDIVISKLTNIKTKMDRVGDRYALIPVHQTRLCDRCYYGCYLNSDKTWNCTAGCPDEDKNVCANNFKWVFDGRDETKPLKPYPDDYECDKQ